MAGRSISALIKLEGAEEIQRLLAAIGKTGEQAFAQVTKAVDVANSSLVKVSAAVKIAEVELGKVAVAGRNVGDAFNKFGSAAQTVATRVAGITAIAVAAASAMAAFGISAVKSADDLGETASALGLTTDAYQKFQFAAVQAGVSQEQFATGIAKFSKQVSEAAAEESKGLLQFAESAGAALQQAGVYTVTFGRKFGDEFKAISEASLKVQQDLKARGIELPLFRITQQLQKLANGTAEQRKQFADLAGKSLPAVNEGLEQLREQAESGGNALRRLGVQTRDQAGNIRPIEDILGDVAEKFKELPEGAKRTALALELFGKGGAKMGAFLSQGRAGIAATIKELERLGILLSKEEVEAADKAANAFDLLGLSAQKLKTRLGLVFAAPLGEAAGGLTRILTQNQAALQEFARSIEAQVTPVVNDLVLLLEGRDAEVQNKWIITARDNVLAFGGAVKGAFLNIIMPAFNGLLAVLGSVANAINSVFGTSFTGGEIGIALVVLKLIGGFGLLTTAIGLAFAALRLFVFTPIGAALTTLGLIILNWESIAKAIEGASKAVDDYNAKSYADATAASEAHYAAVRADIQSVIDKLKELFLLSPDKSGASVSGAPIGSPGPFAGGGMVGGRGTGTSDSNLARLSRGEFVQRARAVRYYGPQFMAALNALRIPRDRLRGFNMGGLVDGLSRSLSVNALPGFAAGGLVGVTPGGKRITVDLRTDAGTFSMTTDEATAEALTRVARRRETHGMSKPSWYR